MQAKGNEYDFIHSKSWREFFDYDESEGSVNISCWPSMSAKITISIVIDIGKKEISSHRPISVKGERGWVEFEW